MSQVRQDLLDRHVEHLLMDSRAFVTFVYGTLRPGEHNYWIEPAVLHAVEDCTTPGVMYARGYPWCNFKATKVPARASGQVTGTLLVMDARMAETRYMLGMEIGAGYEALYVPICLPGSVRPSVLATAWHYPATQRFSDSQLVPSGNYHDFPQSAHYRLQRPAKDTGRWD